MKTHPPELRHPPEVSSSLRRPAPPRRTWKTGREPDTESSTLIKPDDLRRNGIRTVRVERAQREADEVVSLRLVTPDNSALPTWTPGAHVDVVLPSGLVRQYSLCGDPTDRDAYTIAVLRDPAGRGGSIEITDPTLVGRSLGVGQPRNHFPLVEAERYLFIAGGIGITPILPMARAAGTHGATWQLVYAGHTPDSMAFVDELTLFGDGRVELFPKSEAMAFDVDSIVSSAPTDTQVYCCGPERLITAVERACRKFLPPGAFHVERFAAPTPSLTDRQETLGSFDVELRRTGVVLRVPPDRSLLEVVRERIPGVPSSCEAGFCGACEATVLDGIPEHRDTVLTDAEHARNDSMMICVGRAKSAQLVLDL